MFKKRFFKKTIPILMAVIMSVTIFAGCGASRSGPEQAFRDITEAYLEGKTATVRALSADPCSALCESAFLYDDDNECYEAYDNRFKTELQQLEEEYGKKLKLKYKIINVTEYSQDEIDALNKCISEKWGKLYEGCAIQELQVLEIETTLKGRDGKNTETNEYSFYKMDDKWYVGGIFFLPDIDSMENAIEQYSKK